MNDRSLAIHILQDAHDRLSERLTQRIIEAREEIEADADGGSYLSEIETIYDQLGSRLAHVSAMLSNLPPVQTQAEADATVTEIIYADLASASSTDFELETEPQPAVLALPAPPRRDDASQEDGLAAAFRQIVTLVEVNDLCTAARLICECFDLRPSHAGRLAEAFARQSDRFPDLSRRLIELVGTLDETSEHAAAALVGECFESHPSEALLLVRALKHRTGDSDMAQ